MLQANRGYKMDNIYFVSLLLLATHIFVDGLPSFGSYYTDEGARRLVHMDRQSGECKLFGDRRIVEEILRELAASESPVAVLEATELTAIISQCSRRDSQETRAPPSKDFPHIIYPGTKWCGTGNAAEGLEDLGELKDLDTCCRDHDLCPGDIQPGETKHNITNDSPFAMTRCECNDKFRKCLKSVGSPEATEVGTAYYSTGLFQCYTSVKPITGCIKWAGLLSQACQEYSFDENGDELFQAMDLEAFE